jgi:hypothetical protein
MPKRQKKVQQREAFRYIILGGYPPKKENVGFKQAEA